MGKTGANALRLMGVNCGHRPQNKSNSALSATVNFYIDHSIDYKITLRTINKSYLAPSRSRFFVYEVFGKWSEPTGELPGIGMQSRHRRTIYLVQTHGALLWELDVISLHSWVSQQCHRILFGTVPHFAFRVRSCFSW